MRGKIRAVDSNGSNFRSPGFIFAHGQFFVSSNLKTSVLHASMRMHAHEKLPSHTHALCIRDTPPFFLEMDEFEAFRDNRELQKFVLTDVTPTGRVLGTGSYGAVEEVGFK